MGKGYGENMARIFLRWLFNSTKLTTTGIYDVEKDRRSNTHTLKGILDCCELVKHFGRLVHLSTLSVLRRKSVTRGTQSTSPALRTVIHRTERVQNALAPPTLHRLVRQRLYVLPVFQRRIQTADWYNQTLRVDPTVRPGVPAPPNSITRLTLLNKLFVTGHNVGKLARRSLRYVSAISF